MWHPLLWNGVSIFCDEAHDPFPIVTFIGVILLILIKKMVDTDVTRTIEFSVKL